MRPFQSTIIPTHMLAGAVLATLTGAAVALAQPTSPPPDQAQPPSSHSQHTQHQPQPPDAGDPNKSLVDQIAELRAQVARLEAALTQGHAAMRAQQIPAQAIRPNMGMPGMQPQPSQPGGMQGMGGQGGMMGMMNQTMSSEMGGMSGMSQPGPGSMPMGKGMPGMGGMESMMGMSRMGEMPMPGMQVSALPGFPGASHIYHIGATGFFLDHNEHITLTTDQQTRLSQTREKALMEQATAQRKTEQGEQELWDLTASDSPDAAKIEAKVREIEKSRGDQRIAFIRAVGNAASLLTDEQRKQLTGMLPPAPTPPPQQAQPQGGAAGGMGGHM